MALPRRARLLWAYWRAEQRTLRQGLVALALSTLAGFVAGLTLAHITGTLQELPGLIVLIPAAVGMKGTIFGAIGRGPARERRGAVEPATAGCPAAGTCLRRVVTTFSPCGRGTVAERIGGVRRALDLAVGLATVSSSRPLVGAILSDP